MAKIVELQSRITAALDQLSSGVDELIEGKAGAADAGELAALQAQLDEEKTVSAQLEERLKAVKEKQAAELAAAQSQMQDTRAKVDALDLELQRLRKANSALREANAALREANEAGVGDAHLINKAMVAELEALRAARSADVAEASAILTALAPVLSPDADQQEEAADA
ncbi:hypothetical protein E4Z66_01950 [Aliishimia ponticola]|uniref:Colicin transporter n=1 Tax=Aliishimia ponticola TaxID=2499833 RepID=A0A4S4NJD3_9RHOB|nr:hypothetical protein [Aliishimia ponticola]THH38358.1 hypothetical protein E4Z66_01950 [Aliishimia ponticola]